jgi:hypothetical protein
VAGLRAGAARQVITSNIGSHIAGYFEDRIAQDIHDDLCAKAIVLESDDASVAIVVCDLIGVKRGLCPARSVRLGGLSGVC